MLHAEMRDSLRVVPITYQAVGESPCRRMDLCNESTIVPTDR